MKPCDSEYLRNCFLSVIVSAVINCCLMRIAYLIKFSQKIDVGVRHRFLLFCSLRYFTLKKSLVKKKLISISLYFPVLEMLQIKADQRKWSMKPKSSILRCRDMLMCFAKRLQALKHCLSSFGTVSNIKLLPTIDL